MCAEFAQEMQGGPDLVLVLAAVDGFGQLVEPLQLEILNNKLTVLWGC